MKIGILQTGYIPDELAQAHGDYPSMYQEMLSGHGFEWAVYPVVDNNFPESVDECDGWLVTGSRHGAYEAHDWIPPLEDFIRSAYSNDVPIVGICFGHQVIAQALGGSVEKFNGGWGAGKQVYQMNGSNIAIQAMHQDQVIEKPQDAEVIASSEFCKYAGFAYKNKALSYQPHPEFTTEFTRDLINFRKGETLPSEQAEQILRDIDGDLDTIRLATDIASFFKQARKTLSDQ